MKKKKSHHFPHAIFVANPEWPNPGPDGKAPCHKASIRHHHGYLELVWREGKQKKSFHLGKVPHKRSKP